MPILIILILKMLTPHYQYLDSINSPAHFNLNLS